MQRIPKNSESWESSVSRTDFERESSRDFCSFLRNHPIIGLLLNDSPFGTVVILYMLSRDPHRADQVLKEIRNLAPKKKEVILNALQRLSNEGMQQGI